MIYLPEVSAAIRARRLTSRLDFARTESLRSQSDGPQIYSGPSGRDSPYRSDRAGTRFMMEPTMVNPFEEFPEPQAVSLTHICLAQAVVCLSALTSTAVLLSRVLPSMISGLN